MTTFAHQNVSHHHEFQKTVSHKIWDALINPLRATEVRAWLSQNPDGFREMKGEHGESAMHWAALSDMGLILDLQMSGYDFEQRDHQGQTPFDWLIERAVVSLEGTMSTTLTAHNKKKIRWQTDEIGSFFISSGLPVDPDKLSHLRWLSARHGMWSCLHAFLQQDPRSYEPASTQLVMASPRRYVWGPTGEHLLHGLTHTPSETGKERLMVELMLGDESKHLYLKHVLEGLSHPNQAGLTPFLYAMQCRMQPHPHDPQSILPAPDLELYLMQLWGLVGQHAPHLQEELRQQSQILIASTQVPDVLKAWGMRLLESKVHLEEDEDKKKKFVTIA